MAMRSLSALLTTTTMGAFCGRRRWAISSSSGVRPAWASTVKRMTEASARAKSIWRCTSAANSAEVVKSMPPVSTNSNQRPSYSSRVEMRSRVTPAVGSTMEIRRRASMFSKLDLPTLGRPTMATLGKAMGYATPSLRNDEFRKPNDENNYGLKLFSGNVTGLPVLADL